MTSEALTYLSAKDLGLKPGDRVRVAVHALNGHKGASPHHALNPEDMAKRDWLVVEVGSDIVFAAAVRTDRAGVPVADSNGTPLTLPYSHRPFPLEATVFLPIAPAPAQP